MPKTTPGPWSHRNGRIFQTDRPELTIANVARSFDGDYSPSNGDLLAAAPELLEALKEIMADMDSNFGTGYDYNKARAAIAKAEGA